MAQGDFTKEEANETQTAIEEIFKALPKSKMLTFAGHLNDILLFIAAARRHAPNETTDEETED